jgi:hypothetical protein
MSAPEKVVIGNAELWHGDALEVLREWQERRGMPA